MASQDEVLSDVVVAKANTVIGLKVKQGQLNLMARRLFDVLIYNAQQQKTPGVACPEELKKEPVNLNYFWCSLSELMSITDWTSNETAVFKAIISSLQDIKVEFTGSTTWTSEILVSSVKIVKLGEARSASVWIGFSFPPEVANSLLLPISYTRLRLIFNTILTTSSAISLYQIGKRYASNPSHLSNCDTWENWYYILSGNDVTSKLPEFKYFARDILNPAIAQINQNTDINIEVIKNKLGRKIVSLQFKVFNKSESLSAAVTINEMPAELLLKLLEIGFTQKEAEKLIINWTSEQLEKYADFTIQRIKSSKAGTVENPMGYFMMALKGKYNLKSDSDDKKEKQKKPKKPNAVSEPLTESQELEILKTELLKKRADEARQYFNELPLDKQTEALTSWQNTLNPDQRKIMKGGLSKPKVAQTFYYWLAEEQWGVVTDKQIANFAIKFAASHKRLGEDF